MVRYTLYPDAFERLASANLISRLDTARSEGDYRHYYGTVSDDEWKAELRERGYWNSKQAPSELTMIKEKANDFVPLHKKSWTVHRPEGIALHAAEPSEFPVLFGNHAASVLSVQEFWNAEKYGFASHEAFWAAVGAYLIGSGSSSRAEQWTTDKNDQQFVSSLEVNVHHDFVLTQKDVTPYTTVSPLGTEVLCRPVVPVDNRGFNASRGSERSLLVFLLKYVHQASIPSVLANEESAKAYAAHMLAELPKHTTVDNRSESIWLGFDEPFGRIEKNIVVEPTLYALPTNRFVSIDDHNNFVIHDSRELGEAAQQIISFTPEEIDTVVNSLFSLSGQGRGVTFPIELERTIRTYFAKDELQ